MIFGSPHDSGNFIFLMTQSAAVHRRKSFGYI